MKKSYPHLYSLSLWFFGAILFVSGASLYFAPQNTFAESVGNTSVFNQESGYINDNTCGLNCNTIDQGFTFTHSGDTFNNVQFLGNFNGRYGAIIGDVTTGSYCEDDSEYTNTGTSANGITTLNISFVGSHSFGPSGCTSIAGDSYTVEIFNVSRNQDTSTYYLGSATLLNSQICGNNSGICGYVSSGVPYVASTTPMKTAYFSVTTGGSTPPPAPPILTTTRIITVTPADGATVATSSAFTFGVTGYVSTDDYNAGMNSVVVNLAYQQSIGAHLYSWTTTPTCTFGLIPNTNICGQFYFPITSAGSFSFSTTTPLDSETGRYTMRTEIQKPVLYVFTSNLAATTTIFTVSTSTGLDLLGDRISAAVTALNASSTLDLTSCNPTTWGNGTNIGACAYALVIPDGVTLGNDFNSFYYGVGSVAPIGYITRLVTILTNTNAVEPPALTYTFGSSSPAVLQGLTYSVQMFSQFGTFLSIKADDGTNKNIWDIVMPYFNTVVALAVLMVILEDLLGWQIFVDSTQDTTHDVIEDSHGNIVETVSKNRNVQSTVRFQGVSNIKNHSYHSSSIDKTGKNYHIASNRYKRGKSNRSKT